jgi:hypothetical protein
VVSNRDNALSSKSGRSTDVTLAFAHVVAGQTHWRGSCSVVNGLASFMQKNSAMTELDDV